MAALVLFAYWPAGDHPFVEFDDNFYVFRNPHVSDGLTWQGCRWAFTTFHASNWHPLTWLSHMLDVEVFGLSAGWHHRVSIFFHLLNTELLFLVLWRMTGGIWQSTFVAALFGIHPLNVESVAWIAERKNLLSTMFGIFSIGAYLQYVRHLSVKRYLPVVVFHAVGLMCKPMLVTLPFVLLLLDYWPLERFRGGTISRNELYRLVLEKVPLLMLSLVSCIVTYLSQARGISVFPVGDFPLELRISNAVVSYAIYVGKTIWPASLAAIYPHPGTLRAGIPSWQIMISALLLAGFSVLAIWKFRRSPHIAVGWLWYVGTLVPVIGIVQVGAQAYADRYAYVPLIGVFILIAWGIPPLLAGWSFGGRALSVTGCAAVIALCVVSANQVRYWRDNLSLFTRALAVTENNWLAWNNVGTEHRNNGHLLRAISCYREALRIKPDYAMAWYNLGGTHDELGQVKEAIADYEQAVKIWPAYAEARLNLGVAYAGLGQMNEAMENYREALRIKPDYEEAWYNLGLALFQSGQLEHAAACYREALRIRPDFEMARTELARIYSILAVKNDLQRRGSRVK